MGNKAQGSVLKVKEVLKNPTDTPLISKNAVLEKRPSWLYCVAYLIHLNKDLLWLLINTITHKLWPSAG